MNNLSPAAAAFAAALSCAGTVDAQVTNIKSLGKSGKWEVQREFGAGPANACTLEMDDGQRSLVVQVDKDSKAAYFLMLGAKSWKFPEKADVKVGWQVDDRIRHTVPFTARGMQDGSSALTFTLLLGNGETFMAELASGRRLHLDIPGRPAWDLELAGANALVPVFQNCRRAL